MVRQGKLQQNGICGAPSEIFGSRLSGWELQEGLRIEKLGRASQEKRRADEESVLSKERKGRLETGRQANERKWMQKKSSIYPGPKRDCWPSMDRGQRERVVRRRSNSKPNFQHSSSLIVQTALCLVSFVATAVPASVLQSIDVQASCRGKVEAGVGGIGWPAMGKGRRRGEAKG